MVLFDKTYVVEVISVDGLWLVICNKFYLLLRVQKNWGRIDNLKIFAFIFLIIFFTWNLIGWRGCSNAMAGIFIYLLELCHGTTPQQVTFYSICAHTDLIARIPFFSISVILSFSFSSFYFIYFCWLVASVLTPYISI